MEAEERVDLRERLAAMDGIGAPYQRLRQMPTEADLEGRIDGRGIQLIEIFDAIIKLSTHVLAFWTRSRGVEAEHGSKYLSEVQEHPRSQEFAQPGITNVNAIITLDLLLGGGGWPGTALLIRWGDGLTRNGCLTRPQ